MKKIAHSPTGCQDATYHFLPGDPLSTTCLIIRDDPMQKSPPAGTTRVKTDSGPTGHLEVFLLEEFFSMFPNARDQPKLATVLHIDRKVKLPDGTFNLTGHVVLTHSIPDEDPPPPRAAPRQRPKRPRVRRLNIPPADVVQYAQTLPLWPCALRVYRQMYRRSRYGSLQAVPHYPKDTLRKGRYYYCGNVYLARLSGLHKLTVRLILKQLEAANLTYTRYHGYKGRGCSIIELPVNKNHVWKWCRQPGRYSRST